MSCHPCRHKIRPKMRTYKFPVVVERDEDGWYIGSVPALRGCHTQARTLAQLEKQLVHAIKVCLNGERPRARRNTFVGVHQIELRA